MGVFYIFWIAQMVSQIAESVQNIVLSLYLHQLCTKKIEYNFTSVPL